MAELKYKCVVYGCRNQVAVEDSECARCAQTSGYDEDHHERRERTDQEQDDAGHKNSDFA